MSDGFDALRIPILKWIDELRTAQERIEKRLDELVVQRGRSDALAADAREAIEDHGARIDALAAQIDRMHLPRRLDLILDVQGENAAKVSILRRAAINLDARLTDKEVPFPFPDLDWDDAADEGNGNGGVLE